MPGSSLTSWLACAGLRSAEQASGKDDDVALAATPVGSLSPASPLVMLDGTHGYANRQMLQRLLRPDEDVRRRMEEKETPRWGQRAKAADGR